MDNQPATKADINRLDGKVDASSAEIKKLDGKVDVFAEDVKKLNGKVDVFAEDVKKLDGKVDAFAEDIKKLDGKVDASVLRLDRKIDRVIVQVVDVQTELKDVKTKMATKEDIGRILGAIDAFAGKAQNYDRASVLHGRALTEVQVAIGDHEKRLKTIESRQL